MDPDACICPRWYHRQGDTKCVTELDDADEVEFTRRRREYMNTKLKEQLSHLCEKSQRGLLKPITPEVLDNLPIPNKTEYLSKMFGRHNKTKQPCCSPQIDSTTRHLLDQSGSKRQKYYF